jgi:curved DNA-binding protein CbpA
MVLGVPGNASPEEIEAAFGKAERLFPRERLAQEEGALARLNEIRAAYQVLRDPESRAAHDRKLQQQPGPGTPRRPVLVVTEEEPSPLRKVLAAGTCVLALVLAAGILVSYRNAEARRLQAAQELAAQQATAEEARQKREEQERLVAQRAALAAQAEANERRLAAESRMAAVRSASEMRMQEAAAAYAQRVELAEQQRREANRLSEERRAAAEARMRTERDKQRVRELCMQQYSRPDC